MTHLIGLDIGTTTIKAAALELESGAITRIARRPTPTSHPRPEWSEHDADALYDACCECLREAAADTNSIALGVGSLAEAGVALDEQMRPLLPVIAWYDRRTAPQVAFWEERLTLEEMHAITGQRVNPSHGINKLLWQLEHHPEIRPDLRHWLNLPDYILYRLTGEIGTDPTLASRMMLMDQSTLDYAPRIIDIAELNGGLFPPILPGGSLLGRVTGSGAADSGLPENLPCAVASHDHLVGTLAAGAASGGTLIDSCGTSQASLLILPRFITNDEVARRAYASYAHIVPGTYVFKGGSKSAGGAVNWVAKALSGDSDPDYESLEAEAAKTIGKAGPLWLPHFIGAGTPESDREAMAALVGVRVTDAPAEVFRAILEGLALSLRHDLIAMGGYSGGAPDRILLVGGASRINLLNQIKADALNRPVIVPQIEETTAAGAALLGGIAAGVFSDAAEATSSLTRTEVIIEPDPARAAFYADLYESVYAPLYDSLRATNVALRRLNENRSIKD